MNAIEKAGLNLAEACVEPSCKPAAMLDLLGVWTGPSALFWELTVKRRINVSHKKSKRMNIWEPSLKVCKASHKYIVNTLTDGFPREEKSYVILKAHFLQPLILSAYKEVKQSIRHITCTIHSLKWRKAIKSRADQQNNFSLHVASFYYYDLSVNQQIRLLTISTVRYHWFGCTKIN